MKPHLPKPKSKKASADTKAYVPHTRSVNNVVKPTGFGYVEIYHSQDVKLSRNYQSAGCTYGVKLIVEDTKKSIKEGIARAEALVETPLCQKVQEQHEMLGTLDKD